MNKIFLFISVFLLVIADMNAQGLESDSSVLYIKANVLFESGRYDEAVRMYNRILREDENHSASLFMRSKAKYELGAFKGTKNDLLLFIEKVGVTKDVIKVLAATELELSNYEAALNYAITALELDPFDSDMFLIKGDASLNKGDKNEACESFYMAYGLENAKAQRRMRSSCHGYRPKHDSSMIDKVEEDPEVKNDTMVHKETMDTKDIEDMSLEDDGTNPVEGDNDIISLEDIVSGETSARDSDDIDIAEKEEDIREEEFIVEETVDMDAEQSIEFDSKLEVVISDGLGTRALINKPSIFMLSDQDGVVVIDLCIDNNGIVTEAKFDRNNSTIFRSSITSLALRKSKEFIFESAKSFDQCGILTFRIKS